MHNILSRRHFRAKELIASSNEKLIEYQEMLKELHEEMQKITNYFY
ncbi:hypothetical protein JOC77_002208 [Peribacillus deserti]|uniref:Fur-regulated basic protein FbpA n=1 Tax=Peribacillus deserti TaxID=673318 RepID=A0ABS2QI08_9BACI|nr:hypothetical protein [Peribacillus deserti]MBM7692777.1 hypothetical protein [Peribacillus deserti]